MRWPRYLEPAAPVLAPPVLAAGEVETDAPDVVVDCVSDAEVEEIAPGPTRAELLKTAAEGASKTYVSFVSYDADDVRMLSHKICDHKAPDTAGPEPHDSL